MTCFCILIYQKASDQTSPHQTMGNTKTTDDRTLKRFIKVQNSCAQLKECIQVIYDNAFSNEELMSLVNGSETERFVASSPAAMISTYLANARSSVDVIKICDYYKFQSDITKNYPALKEPIITDSKLEHAMLQAKGLRKGKNTKSNEQLQFVGENWLNAFISSILYNRFPFATESALDNLKTRLLSSKKYETWSDELPLLYSFDSYARKEKPEITNEEIKQYKTSCFKAYIGALIIDRKHFELNDVTTWINKKCTATLPLLKTTNLRGLYAGNLKQQLQQFMIGNKSGYPLKFITTSKENEYATKITLGKTVLGNGEGHTAEEAEEKASSVVLTNTNLLSKYSIYSESITIPAEKAEAITTTISKASDKKENESDAPKIPHHLLTKKAEEIKDKKVQKTKSTKIATETPAGTKERAEEEMVKNPTPEVSADAITEQIMSQLNSKVATMVSELTTKILQETNINVNPDIIQNTLSDVQNGKEQAISLAIQPAKKTKLETKTSNNSAPTSLKEISKSEPIDLTIKNFKLPKKQEVKIPLAATASKLTNKVEYSTSKSAREESKSLGNVQLKNQPRNVFLTSPLPAIPKMKEPIKALPKKPEIIKPKDKIEPMLTQKKMEINVASNEEVKNKGKNKEEPSEEESSEEESSEEESSEEESSEEESSEEESSEEESSEDEAEKENVRTKKVQSSNPIKLPLKTSCDKTAKAKLYELVGRLGLFPDYTTIQLGVNDFYSVCSIKDKSDSFMGEGRGSNKKIAEQIAATEALEDEKLLEMLDEKKKMIKDLLDYDSDEEEQELIQDEVDQYEHFQPQVEKEDLAIHTTCNKTAMGNLYAHLGNYRLAPEYKTHQVDINHFYSICSIKNTAVILAEGRGSSKQIAQQIAAERPIDSEELREFLA